MNNGFLDTRSHLFHCAFSAPYLSFNVLRLIFHNPNLKYLPIIASPESHPGRYAEKFSKRCACPRSKDSPPTSEHVQGDLILSYKNKQRRRRIKVVDIAFSRMGLGRSGECGSRGLIGIEPPAPTFMNAFWDRCLHQPIHAQKQGAGGLAQRAVWRTVRCVGSCAGGNIAKR